MCEVGAPGSVESERGAGPGATPGRAGGRAGPPGRADAPDGERAGQPRSTPPHLVLLVIADAAHQVLQVLVEHAVYAALDHLEGHRGGPRARVPGGPRPGAVWGPSGPHLPASERCAAGRLGGEGVQARAAAGAQNGGEGGGDPPDKRPRSRAPPLANGGQDGRRSADGGRRAPDTRLPEAPPPGNHAPLPPFP